MGAAPQAMAMTSPEVEKTCLRPYPLPKGSGVILSLPHEAFLMCSEVGALLDLLSLR
jgi:hypothetical protein